MRLTTEFQDLPNRLSWHGFPQGDPHDCAKNLLQLFSSLDLSRWLTLPGKGNGVCQNQFLPRVLASGFGSLRENMQLRAAKSPSTLEGKHPHLAQPSDVAVLAWRPVAARASNAAMPSLRAVLLTALLAASHAFTARQRHAAAARWNASVFNLRIK